VKSTAKLAMYNSDYTALHHVNVSVYLCANSVHV